LAGAQDRGPSAPPWSPDTGRGRPLGVRPPRQSRRGDEWTGILSPRDEPVSSLRRRTGEPLRSTSQHLRHNDALFNQ
jgi:hypothetical protein